MAFIAVVAVFGTLALAIIVLIIARHIRIVRWKRSGRDIAEKEKSTAEIEDTNNAWKNAALLIAKLVDPLSTLRIRDFIRNVFKQQGTFSNLQKRQTVRTRFFIHPESYFRRALESSYVVFELFYFFSVPFNIAFTQEGDDFIGNIPDYSVDGFFWMCLFSRLATAYYDDNGVLVTDRQSIIRHYMNGDFKMDFLVLFPFELLVIASGTGIDVAAWWRLPKLLRFRSIRAWFRRQEFDITKELSTTGLKKLVFMLTMNIHWLACIWYLLAKEMGKAQNVNWWDVFRANHPDSTFELEMPESRMYRYLVSTYWSFSTMVDAPAGDIFPQSTLEMVFVVLALLTNLTLFTYILGAMSSLITKNSENTLRKRTKMLDLHRFVKDNKLSGELSKELMSHFQHELDKEDVDVNIQRELPYELKVEVGRFVCADLIEHSPLMTGCDPSFVDSITVLLTEMVARPKTEILQTGTHTKELYFVAEGVIEIVSATNEIVKSLNSGTFFGEMSFFLRIRNSYTFRVSTSGFARLYVLDRDDFSPIGKLYPTEEERMEKNAVSFGGWDTTSGMMSVRGGGVSKVASQEEEEEENIASVVAAARKRRDNEKVVDLCLAASTGDMDKVVQYLDGDIELDASDIDGRTPLHLAAADGHAAIVDMLIRKGADLNVKDRRKETPLMGAIRHRHSTVIDILSRAGATIVEDESAYNQLFVAASVGDVGLVTALCNNGIDANAVNYNGRTPLHLAACEGRVEVAKFLLDRNVRINTEDAFGGTPLYDSIRVGNMKLASLLRERGGQLVARICLQKLLKYAASGEIDKFKILVEHGAPINVANYDKRTPLHIAASEGQIDIVTYLLHNPHAKVEVNAVDRYHGTPFSDAVKAGHRMVAKLLESHGGSTSAILSLSIEERDFVASVDLNHSCVECERAKMEQDGSSNAREDDDDTAQSSTTRHHAVVVKSFEKTFDEVSKDLGQFSQLVDRDVSSLHDEFASRTDNLGDKASRIVDALQSISDHDMGIRRVVIRPNTADDNVQVQMMLISKTQSPSSFLVAAGKLLGLELKRFFDIEGKELNSLKMVQHDDTVVVSSGEDFDVGIVSEDDDSVSEMRI